MFGELLLVLIFIVSVFIFLKKGAWYTLVLLPIITITMDIIVMHGSTSNEASFVSILRGIVSISILILISKKVSTYNYLLTSIIILLAYFLIIVIHHGINEGNLLIGIDFVARVGISIAPFILAFTFVTNEYKYNRLCVYTLWSGVIFVLYIITVNVFGIGQSLYLVDDDIVDFSLLSVGYMGGNYFNFLAFVLVILPVIFKSRSKFLKLVSIITGLSGLLILLLTFRRASLIIILLAIIIFVYAYNNKKFYKYYIVVIVLILLTLIPSYSYIIDIISYRGDQVLALESLSTAGGRLNEVERIFEIIQNSELSKIIFGTSINTRGIYGATIRSLHSDVSVIIYMFGMVGLLLFSLKKFLILHSFTKLKKFTPDKLYTTLFTIFFLCNIILMIPGRMTSISFNLLVYLHMGALLGLFYNNYKNSYKIKIVTKRD